MIDKIIYNIKKYEGVLLYLIFGVLTTLINMAVYYALYEGFNIPNIVSNTNAWIAAVVSQIKYGYLEVKALSPVSYLRSFPPFYWQEFQQVCLIRL